jgi:hypothetical protein
LAGALLTGAALIAWFFGDPNYKNRPAREHPEKSKPVSPPAELRPKEV